MGSIPTQPTMKNLKRYLVVPHKYDFQQHILTGGVVVEKDSIFAYAFKFEYTGGDLEFHPWEESKKLPKITEKEIERIRLIVSTMYASVAGNAGVYFNI